MISASTSNRSSHRAVSAVVAARYRDSASWYRCFSALSTRAAFRSLVALFAFGAVAFLAALLLVFVATRTSLATLYQDGRRLGSGYRFRSIGYRFRSVGYRFRSVGYRFRSIGYRFRSALPAEP